MTLPLLDHETAQPVCPCGCGYPLAALRTHTFDAGAFMETCLLEAGITMDQVRSASRATELVEARREAAKYLREHGWALPRIGRFMARDHTTVHYLLYGRNRRAG